MIMAVTSRPKNKTWEWKEESEIIKMWLFTVRRSNYTLWNLKDSADDPWHCNKRSGELSSLLISFDSLISYLLGITVKTTETKLYNLNSIKIAWKWLESLCTAKLRNKLQGGTIIGKKRPDQSIKLMHYDAVLRLGMCVYGSQEDSQVTHLLPENEDIQLTSYPIILSWAGRPVIGWLTSLRGSGWQFILGAMQFTQGGWRPLCHNLAEAAGTSLTLHWACRTHTHHPLYTTHSH